MSDQASISATWEKLNFLGEPNYTEALNEYGSFEAILDSAGVEISYFGADESLTMDAMYCRDASIVTDFGVILCNMGKEDRLPEPTSCATDYHHHGLKVLGEITEPGYIEGGDVAWIDQYTLAVAHGYRSNDEGFRQLKSLLNPHGIEVFQVDLPHYKGSGDVFHLMSIFSPVDERKAVVYSPLMPVRFRAYLLQRGIELIEVPVEEFESMGCNVLAIAPSRCIMVAGNPITESRLIAAGCEVTIYKGDEISVKGGGGPTCLTRPIERVLES